MISSRNRLFNQFNVLNHWKQPTTQSATKFILCRYNFDDTKSLDIRERARQKISKLDAEQSCSPNTPLGMMNRSPLVNQNDSLTSSDILTRTLNPVYGPFPDNKNPKTGEIDGPTGPEPTRYGDWERKGRCSDF